MTTIPRVVILGASGHIGRSIEKALVREGAEVIGHSSRTLDLTRPEALSIIDAIVDPDAVLVFAAALTPDRGQNIGTLMTNLAMAANVGQYLETHPVGRCVYLSSDAVYGFEDNPVTEATPPAPASYYALAKYAAERLLECVAAARGVSLLCLRVTAVFGPGDPHSAYGPNAFARSLARERALQLFGDGEEERDHIYVEDVARLVTELIRARASGLLNLATGESRPFRDVAKTMCDLVPYDATVSTVPRRGLITHRRYDTTRLQAAVPGFRFTLFEVALRETLQAFGAI